MNTYLVIKMLHIVSATIRFGTGLETAYFMFRSRFSDSLPEKFYAVRTTVLAAHLFTALAVVIQPLTGFWLVWQGLFSWTDTWLSRRNQTYLRRR